MRKLATLTVLALAALLLVVAACGGDSEENSSTPTPTGTPTPGDSPTPSATATPTPEPTPSPTPTEPPAQQQPSGDGLDLRVGVFDDAIDRPAANLEVWLRGYGSWYPDVSFGGDVLTYEMLWTEGEPNMFIYPDGRGGGVEIPVTFEIPPDFIPGSVRDALQISVSDTTVTVFGTVIPSLEIEFTR